MTTKNICPVCGYDKLERPIHDYDICPCCRCEFGISDCEWTHDELREDWITHGAQWAWGSVEASKPFGWSPYTQLRNIKYNITDHDKTMIAPAQHKYTGVTLQWHNEPTGILLINWRGVTNASSQGPKYQTEAR